MAQIGTIRLQTPAGWTNVPVHNPGDVTTPALRVQTPSGWGAIPLTGTQDGTALKILTGSGWQFLGQTAGGAGNSPIAKLLSMWELEEASGNRADAHGSNTLSSINSVGQATGQVGNAADFNDASSQMLDMADNASVSFADENFAAILWVKLDDKLGDMGLLAKWEGGGGPTEYMVYYDAGPDRFRFIVYDGAGSTVVQADTFGSPPTITWCRIYVYHNATADEIGISVDNGAVDTISHTTGCNDDNSSFTLGAYSRGANYLDGKLDQVQLYGDVLTSTELNWEWNSGNGRAYSEF